MRDQPVKLANPSMKNAWLSILEVIAWLAPVLALPLYLCVFIGMGLSPGVSHISFGGFAILGIAPFISLLALLVIVCYGKVTLGTRVAMLIPALLSLAELIFAFLVWIAA